MAKRHVTFEDLEEGEGPPRKRVVPGGGPGSRFSGKPSLDSDEEEEEEEEEEAEGSGGLRAELWEEEEEEEGEEPAGAWPEGAGRDPEVPLTPFHLREELQEGTFDPQGHFLPHRRPLPPDPWLESLEGVPIKPRPLPRDDVTGDDVRSPSPPPLPHLLRGALALLLPGETVGGALRRLGGAKAGKGRGRQRVWPRPRPSPQLEALVELADGLVGRGLLGVYGEHREGLEGRLRALGHAHRPGHAHQASNPAHQASNPAHEASNPAQNSPDHAQESPSHAHDGADHAPSCSDHAPSGSGHTPSDAGHAHDGSDRAPSGSDHAPSGSGHAPYGSGHAPSAADHAPSGSGHAPLDIFAPPEEEEGAPPPLPPVLWEFQWGEGEGGSEPPLYGPFSSSQMQEWASQGYFEQGGGARCRRVQPPPPGPFYDVTRVDFELYG